MRLSHFQSHVLARIKKKYEYVPGMSKLHHQEPTAEKWTVLSIGYSRVPSRYCDTVPRSTNLHYSCLVA